MNIREHVPLAILTTLRAGGPARFVVDCLTEDDVRSALVFAHEHSLPAYVLGEGSNVLASDAGYRGVVIHVVAHEISFQETEKGVDVLVDAGMSWNAFVDAVTKRGLWGVENLAGIPGTVGAAPVQNIGAYGAEVSTIIRFVEGVSRATGETQIFSVEECAFEYRDSRFKQKQDVVITRVGFHFSSTGVANLSYPDLERASDVSTPSAVAEVVRAIRARKFPNLREFGTAGSFFKNPVVSEETYTRLAEQCEGVPRFQTAYGVKIPLAFILDRVLSLKGYRMGHASLFHNQPLVLVLAEGGTASEVEALAQFVEARVQEATGISIEREVRFLS